ncbi:sulfatase-like hydrolase/transferase [Thalassotalea sp. PLHSN55]|uniref:sulfatase-like hydrolase/transferase n=1 Tax=Thalassotalea sp. PLHSN55 TaxID=3435888 RepID=UPI003F8684C1
MNKILVNASFLLAFILVTFGVKAENYQQTKQQAKQQLKQKPNIIVILADDLGYAGLSSFGGQGIATPELDKLAEQGIKLTNFYANSTVCSPTRTALLSGRYQQRVGLDHIYFHCEADKGFDAQTNPTMAKILKNAGYTTGIFGKWHLGASEKFQPKAHGFDEFTGFLDGNIDFISKHNTESDVDWYKHHQPNNDKGYVTELLNDAVVEFIDKAHDKPFFVYFSQAAVHVPMQGPNDAPLRTDDFYTYKVDNKLPKAEYMRRYADMLTSMDQGVGRIMATLKKHNIEDNTLVIFTSDNGGEPMGVKHGKVNGDLRGHKVTMYEGGLKVPTLVYWQGKLIGGREETQPMLTMDLLPTILDVANIDYSGKQTFDGVSLANLLLKGEKLAQRDLFWMHRERLVMRRGDMKLIRTKAGNELFNLANDPNEKNNLAKLSQYQALIATMTKAGDNWQKETAIGVPGERIIGKPVKANWPCKRNLRQFNGGKKYYWQDGEAVIK